MRSIRKEIVIHANIEEVWRSVTDRSALSDWYMKTEDFEPIVGCEFLFTDKPQGMWDGKVHGVVLEVEAPTRLVYSFWGNQMNYRTTVTWTLSEEGDATRVLIEHDGFKGFGGWLMRGVITMGWKKFLGRLRDHVVPN